MGLRVRGGELTPEVRPWPIEESPDSRPAAAADGFTGSPAVLQPEASFQQRKPLWMLEVFPHMVAGATSQPDEGLAQRQRAGTPESGADNPECRCRDPRADRVRLP